MKYVKGEEWQYSVQKILPKSEEGSRKETERINFLTGVVSIDPFLWQH
jgi:hypothetical protein